MTLPPNKNVTVYTRAMYLTYKTVRKPGKEPLTYAPKIGNIMNIDVEPHPRLQPLTCIYAGENFMY